MSGFRLPAPHGVRIDRGLPVEFTFNSKRYSGFQGDTLASALIASGVRLVGRSFKLHRPRGIFSCGVEEPTGLLEVGEGAQLTPNTRATDIELTSGLMARSSNCWPSVGFDVAAVNSKLAAFMPSGFYYKTFMWPNWHLFEPTIRKMAGMSLASSEADCDRYDVAHATADVLVVGAGMAGTQAAVAAANEGAAVTLIAAGEPHDAKALAEAGVKVLRRTTAVGVYDHLLVCAVEQPERQTVSRERLWKIRAGSLILATGTFERPMVFPDNDRPGVMLATAVERYASRFGVACGRSAVVAASADYAYPLAARLLAAGIQVKAIVDRRAPADIAARSGVLAPSIEVLTESAIVGVKGTKSVRGVTISGSHGRRLNLDADLVCSAGGMTPNVSLFSMAGGSLRWLEESSMFVPDRLPHGVQAVGACAGVYDAEHAVEHARCAGIFAARQGSMTQAPPQPRMGGLGNVLADNRPSQAWLGHSSGKAFVDLQSDVGTSDIDLAARENYRSVEHLKRYTTTGMGTDQGKTSNVNALVQMGAATGRSPGQVGTTKFRPPYKPVTLGLIAAGRSGTRLRPVKKLPAHAWHEQRGALMEEFGAWIRPACYPLAGESMEQAAQREASAVRTHVGLFDGSPLGKLEIHGPDAAAFLDWMYVGTMSTLKVGSARYGAIISEHGVLTDDGIVARLAHDRFWVNTSSAGAERTALVFEDWLQRDLMDMRVSITPVTSHWANVTVAGPRAWELLKAAGFPAELAPEGMAHMTMRCVQWHGEPVRVMRASFSGELGYEINIAASKAQALFDALWLAGRPLNAVAYGVEALQIMRIEKGFIHIGTDTDGATYPDDVGLARVVAKKASDFVGRRSLSLPVAVDDQRQQLVGLVPVDKRSPLPVGAHVAHSAPPTRSEGYVTSSCLSPALGHPIALARLSRGRERIGEKVKLFNMGKWIDAEVAALPFLDAKGERLNGN